jgi:hypothetical protein
MRFDERAETVKKISLFVTILLVALPIGIRAGVDRLEVSPSALINMAEGHSGDFMGGAVTTDLFFNRSFALRTTIGFTRNRYFPKELPYEQADYGFWLSFAPYAELNVGNRVRPYLAVLGTFTAGGYNASHRQPVGFETAPVARLQSEAGSGGSFYSFGLTVGSKVRLAGSIYAFTELSHYLFTSITQPDNREYFGVDGTPFARSFDFEHNPTYLSFGLTYGFDIGKK